MKFSEKGAGGGSKAVRKFSGNSFESGDTGFPKMKYAILKTGVILTKKI